jgi:hypothetical protein
MTRSQVASVLEYWVESSVSSRAVVWRKRVETKSSMEMLHRMRRPST